MKTLKIAFEAELWIYSSAKASWYFVTLPQEDSSKMKLWNALSMCGSGRGFGSIPIKAKIGETEWKTSIFPDSKKGSYILPIKAAVRKGENITKGDVVKVVLESC